MKQRRPTLYPSWEADDPSRPGSDETATDYHGGVELAPSVPESLVTWDVSGHAQCEKDRMNAACRTRGAMHHGY
ncbi:MAG: hypothetical protein EHM50_09210 [Lysobacterales bacterium]|nr:MAG: hypothetical protein EHM50_09210 [Xanthomonadales bacterium]